MTNRHTTPLLGALLSSQSLATPLRDALGHLSTLGTQQQARIEALEQRCDALKSQLDAQQAQTALREALLTAKIDEHDAQLAELFEASQAEEALAPREDFSPTLRARLAHPGQGPIRMDDFVVVDLPTTSFGAREDDPFRSVRDLIQQVVRVPTVFAIQRTPLTWSQWCLLMDDVPGHVGDQPVRDVLVWRFLELCNKLSVLDGLEPCYLLRYDSNDRIVSVRLNGLGASGYRLPLEVEWEAAARAGETGAHYGDPDRIAWHSYNSDKQFKPVGQLQPNALGLFDTLGNVREVVWGSFRMDADMFAFKGISNELQNTLMSRGGSRLYSSSACRLSGRATCKLDRRAVDLGVRLVRTLRVRE